LKKDLINYLTEHDRTPKLEVAKKGILLARSGANCNDIFIIEKGAVKASEWIDDKEQIIRFGYPQSWITALDSFLGNTPTKYDIETIRTTKFYRISKKDFSAFLHANPQRLIQWTQLLEKLVLQQMERESDLLYASPRNRYERVLLRSPQLFQEIPLKHIANYLRMTPETLSRLRKESFPKY
jgi:CRP/FNR family transcriptional regulator, anaerobic regulatory protein